MDKKVLEQLQKQVEAFKAQDPEAVKAYVLTLMATDLTRDILTPEFAHMLPLWKAILGGYVGRTMQKIMPDQVDAKRQAMIDTYNKEAIEKMLNPEKETVEKVVEKVVEKIVYQDNPAVDQDDNSPFANFRYRKSVNKKSRYKRSLIASERQVIIEQFNTLQKMMDPNDEVCKKINDQLYNQLDDQKEKLSNPQIAGYWSWLCRLVNFAEQHQQEWYKIAVEKGSIPTGCPMPKASNEFKREIMSNANLEAMIKKEREKYKARMSSVHAKASQVTQGPSSIDFS